MFLEGAYRGLVNVGIQDSYPELARYEELADDGDNLTWQRRLGSAPVVTMPGTVSEPATSLLSVVAAAGIRHLGGRLRQELASA